MAYTPASMEQLLEQGARAYINHPRGVSCQDGTCTLSSIYVWFQEDFAAGIATGVRHHLLRYARRLGGAAASEAQARSLRRVHSPVRPDIERLVEQFPHHGM